MKISNGIYTDVHIDDYHANKTHYSASGIKHAKNSLKEWYFYLEGYYSDDKRKSHFDFGNACELAVLDKVGFDNNVAIWNDSYYVQEAKIDNPKLVSPRASKFYKDHKAEFFKNNESKYIINDKGRDSFECIEHIITECYQNAVINKLIHNIEYQYSCFWTDEATGLSLKTRPDICRIKNDIIIDVKTTDNANPDKWWRKACDFDYPLQAIMQIDGVQKSGLIPKVKKYYWLVLEKVAPFSAVLYEFDTSDWASMFDGYSFLLQKIADAQNKNKFPSYGDRADNEYGILPLRIPSYYGIYNI